MWVLWFFLVVSMLGGLGYLGARYCRYMVPADHVGVVLRRFGPADLRFRTVTPGVQRGWQAVTLPPGQGAWLPPFLYKVELVPRVVIPANQIGLVIALEGATRPRFRKFGRYVECDNFQDGRAFLLNGGEQGHQVATLAGGQTYYINPHLFRVTLVPRTYVPSGTVGLVSATDGQVRPPHHQFGKHVECENFQDGQAFLDGGGEQGRQLSVLAGGTFYDINPWMFDVVTTRNVASSPDGLTEHHLAHVTVPIGYAGVVITLDGAEPTGNDPNTVGPIVEGHDNFRLPWVFLEHGGWRGVQGQTLGEGTVLPLNSWFIRVVLVPTRVLVMEWHDRSSETRTYDAKLERIVANIQGHQLHVEMSQNLRIPREAAPKLVKAFGSNDTSPLGGVVNDPRPVQEFVDKVLGRTVEAYISGIAAEATVAEFLQRYSETRTDLAAQLRNALQSWEIEAISTNLGQFEARDEKLNEQLRRVADEQIRHGQLEAKLDNVRLEDQIDAIEVHREQRRACLELAEEIRLIGPENATMIRLLREAASFPVPKYIGGGDVSEIVNNLPAFQVQQLITQLRAFRLKPSRKNEGGMLTGQSEPEPVNCSVFTSGDNGIEVKFALEAVLDSVDVEIADEDQPVLDQPSLGSWFQQLRLRAKRAVSPSVAQRVPELEKALRLDLEGQVSADIDRATADAVHVLLAAVDDQESAVVRLDSLLVLKAEEQVVVWTLSEAEAADVEKHNNGLFRDPVGMLNFLRWLGGAPANDRATDLPGDE